jgi:oxygen-independent coproporphyrinogen-3 oxidase
MRQAQLETAVVHLNDAGYEHLGMDLFILPGDALARARADGTLQRNLLGYTVHSDCDIVGLGVGAISHIGDCFSQNARELRSWEQAIDAGRLPVARGRHLDFDDTLRADVIGQIVCLGRIDVAALERRYLVDFRRYFADACARLTALANDGLVTVLPDRIDATSRGQWLLRIIAGCFDRYLNEPLEPAQRRKA